MEYQKHEWKEGGFLHIVATTQTHDKEYKYLLKKLID